jgi:N6-L-threonylcarbamoyladenine synthase
LKTAVVQAMARLPNGTPTSQQAADIAASFQQAVADVLADRAVHAMALMRADSPTADMLVVAGGVAANQAIRASLDQAARANGFRMVAPPMPLCSDNAVMVAWAAIERLRLGLTDTMAFDARPRWPLEALAPRAPA